MGPDDLVVGPASILDGGLDRPTAGSGDQRSTR